MAFQMDPGMNTDDIIKVIGVGHCHTKYKVLRGDYTGINAYIEFKSH